MCTRDGMGVHIFLLNAFLIRIRTIVDSARAHRPREILTVRVCRHVFLQQR